MAVAVCLGQVRLHRSNTTPCNHKAHNMGNIQPGKRANMSENTKNTALATEELSFAPLVTKNGDTVDNLEMCVTGEHVYIRASHKVDARKSKSGKSFVLGATAGVSIPGIGDNGGYVRCTIGLQLSADEKKVATIEAKRAELAKLEAELG